MFSLPLWLFFILILNCNCIDVLLNGDDWSISNDQDLEDRGTVPGTVHTILFSAKLIDDPYWRYQDSTLRYLVNQSWIFTKQFSLEEDFLN